MLEQQLELCVIVKSNCPDEFMKKFRNLCIMNGSDAGKTDMFRTAFGDVWMVVHIKTNAFTTEEARALMALCKCYYEHAIW